MLVRAARPADGPLLEEIEREGFPLPRWVAADFSRYSCLVAEWEGNLAGFLVSQQVFSGERPEREILNLAVRFAHRRLGCASALLEALLRERAVYFLEVRESNSPAQSLYQKFGFQVVGKRLYYYENPTESGIVMRAER